MSSFQTGEVAFKDALKDMGWNIAYSIQKPFYNDSRYINILKNSIKSHLTDDVDHLLFSYHGIPERHVRKTDASGNHCLKKENCCDLSHADNPDSAAAQSVCYQHHVKETTRLVTNSLGVDDSFYSLSFQSRLGSDPWLTPFTDKVIAELAEKGIKHLAVVCPAFITDCLETLEEIGKEAAEIFKAHGGECLTLIPCLNDQDPWIQLLSEMALA